MRLALVLAGVVALTACSGEPGEDTEAKATDVPQSMATTAAAAPAVESEYGTPVKDRVVTLGLLNKRNNIVQDLTMKPGEVRRLGNVVVKLATCERSLPWETPPEVGAFVQVYVQERANTSQPLAWHSVFSGWLFKNSPSLNVVEHPVYDVWVKDCAMKFPGEEESPASAASASTAAKPSGNAAAAARPAPSASPSTPPPAQPPASPTT